ncbi:uncharacterized protein LOC108680739 [Hyalella azteca]|uniref:mRNA (guanine-N(7))-methyltransferase n=1 Tax=Hyalella azteca TaxID=294128 RepID=A0A8B7PG48_HYAAZ|nr:uncharacterized protein LOC108680739 [Hyalella azteca]
MDRDNNESYGHGTRDPYFRKNFSNHQWRREGNYDFRRGSNGRWGSDFEGRNSFYRRHYWGRRPWRFGQHFHNKRREHERRWSWQCPWKRRYTGRMYPDDLRWTIDDHKAAEYDDHQYLPEVESRGRGDVKPRHYIRYHDEPHASSSKHSQQWFDETSRKKQPSKMKERWSECALKPKPNENVYESDGSCPQYQRYWDTIVSEKKVRSEVRVESRVEFLSENSRNKSEIHRQSGKPKTHIKQDDGKRQKSSEECRPSHSLRKRSVDRSRETSNRRRHSRSSSSSSFTSISTPSDSCAFSPVSSCSTDELITWNITPSTNKMEPHASSQFSSSWNQQVWGQGAEDFQEEKLSNIPVLVSSSQDSSIFSANESNLFNSSINTSDPNHASTTNTSQDSGVASVELDSSVERADARTLALEQLSRLTRWVLGSCIKRYMPSVRPPLLTAMQLGTARDTDVSKWTENGIQHVLMVDSDWLKMTSAMQAYKKAQAGGEKYSVDWICRNFTREVWPHTAVDVACSHLAVHTALESSTKTELFAHNTACSLKEGSCLVATVISSAQILRLLRKEDSGRKYDGRNFKLRLHGHSSRRSLPDFGVRFTLQIGKEQFEGYVVQISVIEDIFSRHSLQLINHRSFLQLFDHSCNFSPCLQQLRTLRLVGNNTASREKLSPVLQDIAELFDVLIFRKLALAAPK